MALDYIALTHRDDALNAAWEAFLSGVQMTWLRA